MTLITNTKMRELHSRFRQQYFLRYPQSTQMQELRAFKEFCKTQKVGVSWYNTDCSTQYVNHFNEYVK